MRNSVVAVALLFVCFSGSAQEVITARTGTLPPDSVYLPVDLGRLANNTQAVTFPADRVQLWSVPFDLPKNGAANCLFIKPIGWSAATDESGEYPSYIAKYDTWYQVTNDTARAMVKVPVAEYAAIWLLAAADNDTNLSNVVTFRLGVADGQSRTTWHDVTATIPRAGGQSPGGNVVKVVPTATGNLYLVRVPFGVALAQDFSERSLLDLDITKELRVAINAPDPYRYQLRPLGAASGVRIYGLTLERSAVWMDVTSPEPANVFNEPQTPTFHVQFSCRSGNGRYSLETVTRSDDGQVATNAYPELNFSWNPIMARTLSLPVLARGHYELAIIVRSGDQVVTRRTTTFALLAPDTRQHRDESPFGTWDFGGVHFTPTDWDLLGSLYVKAGPRYGMAQWMVPEAKRRQYGVLSGMDYRITSTNNIQVILQDLAEHPDKPAPPRFLVFHETAISGPHLTRTPDLFTGRPPYQLNADEQKQFSNMWAEAEIATPGPTSARNAPTSRSPR